MARTTPRPKRHSVKRDRFTWQGFGPLVPGGDADSGDPLPYSQAVRQRGRWVFADYRKGSRDLPDKSTQP